MDGHANLPSDQERSMLRDAIRKYVAFYASTPAYLPVLAHAGLQDIHEELRRRGEGIGLTTVYRTLQALAEAGEIDVLRTAAGEASYRRCSDTHHHHLVCRRCGRTVEVEGPAVEHWAEKVAAEHGFAEIDHTVEIIGVCAACRAA